MSDSRRPPSVVGLSETVLAAAGNAGLGVVVTQIRPELKNLYVSDRAAEIMGVSVETAVSEAPIERVTPRDRARVQELARRASQQGTNAPSVEITLLRGDGREVPVEYGRSFVQIDGQPAVVAFLRDVSERRRAEQDLRRSEARLRNLIDSAPDGVVGSRGRQIVFANPAAAALLGFDDPGELVGQSVADFLHPDDYAAMDERTGALTLGGPSSPPREYRARARDGRALVVEVTSILFDDIDGPTVVGFARDVTESRRLQAQLMRADRLVAVGTMAAGVAHEINNPLAFMMLGVESIRRRLGSDEIDREAIEGTLADVRHGIERIAQIVRQLRVFSRSGTEPERALADVASVVAAAARMAEHEVRPYGRIDVDIPEGLPPVRGGGSQLEQVFLNLLLNAAHAIEDLGREGRIRVSARRLVETGLAETGLAETGLAETGLAETGLAEKGLAEKGAIGKGGEPPAVEIEVRDDGRGIAAEDLELIFDPFFTTKPVGAGTGLGLSICHSIVTGLGGQMRVESAPGQGTAVIVRLPAQAPSEPVATSSPDRELPPVGVTPRLRILIVDDEPGLVRAITEALALEHDVMVATGGEQAWQRVAADDPDLVLLDVMMPKMSGIELFERLRVERPDAVDRVVFISGGIARPKVERFLSRAGRPVLRKPFSTARLQRLIARVARSSSSRQ